MPGEDAVGEALVVTEIKISLRTVIEHINFAVLERVHCPRINIQVRIKLLENHPQPTCFEQRPERGCGQSLAQRTYDPASDENIFHPVRALSCARASFCSNAFASAGVSTPGEPCLVMST